MGDPFIKKTISLADGENVTIPPALSELHKKGVRDSLIFLGNREFMEASEIGATDKFEFSKKTKKRLEMAITTHISDVEEEAQKYAKDLIKDYEWVIQNAGLLKKVSNFFKDGESSSQGENDTESLAQFIEDKSDQNS